MNFYDYWQGLTTEQKQAFAEKCELSAYYISNQLIYGYKSPKLSTLDKMAKASDGVLTYNDLCNFFKPKTEALV